MLETNRTPSVSGEDLDCILDQLEYVFIALGYRGNNLIHGPERKAWEHVRQALASCGRLDAQVVEVQS